MGETQTQVSKRQNWGIAEKDKLFSSPNISDYFDLIQRDSLSWFTRRVYFSYWKIQTLIPIPEFPRAPGESFTVFTVCVASPRPLFSFSSSP